MKRDLERWSGIDNTREIEKEGDGKRERVGRETQRVRCEMRRER